MKQLSKLIKEKRKDANLSQSELSVALGYKNGQFISNIERDLCGVPLKKAGLLCELIVIDPNEFKAVLMFDFENKIDAALL